MITQKYPVLQQQIPFDEAVFPDDALFFDIETTGLSHRSSHLYMIGAICKIQGELTFIQWFLQKPSEEKEVLALFSELVKKYRTLIHFNGQSFDIPYLQDRCKFWDLDDPFSFDESMKSLDLYLELRKYRKALQMTSMKQKDWEKFLHFLRNDRMSGKELIQVYHTYLQTGGDRELQLLLLHNHDDLYGMLPVYDFYNWLLVSVRTVSISDWKVEGDDLIIQSKTERACPRSLSIANDEAELITTGNQITLTVRGRRGTFRHYYSNYKDYFYLPMEDTAIHKSVGIYVDPSCREKAKADTCYTKKEGLFFYQPSTVFLPDFRQDGRKGPSYFSHEQIGKDPEALICYTREMLTCLLKS